MGNGRILDRIFSPQVRADILLIQIMLTIEGREVLRAGVDTNSTTCFEKCL